MASTVPDTIFVTADLVQFACEKCGKIYKSKDSLTRHLRNHDNDLPHVCLICYQRFARRDVLSRHTRGHQSARRRSWRACKHCKAAKLKCNAKLPCSRCIKSSQTCTFENDPSQGDRHSSYLPRKAPHRLNDMVMSLSPINVLEKTPSTEMSGDDFLVPTVLDDLAPGQVHEISIVNTLDDTHGNDLGPVDSISRTVATRSQKDDLQSLDDYFTQEDFETLNLELRKGVNHPSGSHNRELGDIGISTFITPVSELFSFEMLGENSQFSDAFLNSSPLSSSDSVFEISEIEPVSDTSTIHYSSNHISRSQLEHSYAQPIWMTDWNTAFPLRIQDDLNLSIPPIDERTSDSFAQIQDHLAMQKIAESLITFAFREFPDSCYSIAERRNFWATMAPNVRQVFLGSSTLESLRAGDHVLNYFVDLYFRNFHPLWSLFRMCDFDIDEIPPPLYLIMTATGAMYSGESGRTYGSMMLEHIFSALLTSRCLYDQTLQPSDMVLRFMLLTQVAALYFGQRHLFSRALHLGSIIISEARQANLFDEPDKNWAHYPNKSLSPFDFFIHLETRSRIVFGIFRADTFMSAVLNSRPMMSSEELNLTLPCPDEVWSNGDEGTWRDYMSRQDHNKTILYSDLARIAMERSERMPQLSVAGQALVLFATQESIWRFCHDPTLFDRMIGNKLSYEESDDEFDVDFSPAETRATTSESGRWGKCQTAKKDHLDLSLESKMNDLKSDYSRTVYSLRKWKYSLVNSIASGELQKNRDRLLNGRLLYHLSFLRLTADVGIIGLASSESVTISVNQIVSRRVYQWSHSQNAQQAIRHALSIWSLVSKESKWEHENRAKFNILTLIALYHAAIVVWVYAGSHESSNIKLDMDSEHNLPVERRNSRFLLLCFEELFGTITSGWGVMSSFAQSMSQLTKQQCPFSFEN